jgi:hypothetical protein
MKPEITGNLNGKFRARIVRLIINGQTEKALRLLSEHYRIDEPDLRVGTVKRYRHVAGCYVHKEKRIYLSKGEYVTNPFLILHEFYHHLRASQAGIRGQVDKRADRFALDYISEWLSKPRSA